MLFCIKYSLMTKIIQILETIWYQDKKPPLLLIALSRIYGFLFKTRKALFDSGVFSSDKPEVPVIVVGNLNVGGTGKTPLTLYLANALSKAGKKVGIATRGYKGKKSNSMPYILDETSDAQDYGDEAVYLSRHSNAIVCICSQRLKAANLLFERGVDVILSDDGLQHFALKRDLELVVVSSDRAFGNRRLLPAGPLREGLDRLDTIDLICLNGKKIDDDLHLENTIGFEIENKTAKNIHNGQILSIDAFINHDVNLIAGIGDPNVLVQKLIKLGININHIKVADHAAIDSSEIKNLQGTSLFLTPKDLVKYSKDDLPKETWELIPEMMIDASQAQSLMNKIFEIIQ